MYDDHDSPPTGSGYVAHSEADASGPLRLELLIEDAECVAALSAVPEGRERARLAKTALRIGILALSQAQGRVDADAVRSEGERLIQSLEGRLDDYRRRVDGQLTQTLREYFDPRDGRFSERVERLVRQDGELERLMRGQIQAVESAMSGTLTRHLGADSPLMSLLSPEEGNRLVQALKANVEASLEAQRALVLREFTLDNPDGALARLVRELTERHGAASEALGERIGEVIGEFSLDDENSALSRLVQRVERAQQQISAEFSLDAENSALARMRRELVRVLEEHRGAAAQFQQAVLESLAAMRARKAESARSTVHGREFQDAGAAFLMELSQRAGDVFEDVGDIPGAIPRSKVGDAVVTLGPDCAAAGARLAVEFKEAANYTLKSSLDEIRVARQNREAAVGLFVHSRRTAPSGLEPLCRFGEDIVAVWDPEDESSDAYLRAAFILAKAIAVRSRAEADAVAADLHRMDAAIAEIVRQALQLEEVSTWSGTIRNNADKILTRVDKVRDALGDQAESLARQLASLKSGAK